MNPVMVTEVEIKQQVRDFYNQVGWQEVSEGCYQNASYEDLRPVAREYIHRCHLRVGRHIPSGGRFLLDAGSGPIQYPEYLEYSHQFKYRVCLDISIVALREAQKRIKGHGLFVVADIARLPFKPDCFDGLVSLHTVHHLPSQEHVLAYQEFFRVLTSGSSAVIVNGWDSPPLAALTNLLIHAVEWLYARLKGKPASNQGGDSAEQYSVIKNHASSPEPTGTYVSKHNAAWLRQEVGEQMPVEIWVWRSVGVRFLRTFIHEKWGGRGWLRLLFWLEERFPHFLGKIGQYPLIVVNKASV